MAAVERFAIAAVGAITAVLGGAFVATYWSSRGLGEIGVGRAAMYLVIMAAVTVCGYSAYQRQRSVEIPRLSVQYRPALRVAMVQLLVVLVLGALALDNGQCAAGATLAALAYALSVAIIFVRRPTAPTAADLFWVRYGMLFSTGIAVVWASLLL